MILVALAVALPACVMMPRVNRTNAVGQVKPQEREKAFSKALRAVQSDGWIVAVSDGAAGLLTTQTMNNGSVDCGLLLCESRSTLQITIGDEGGVVVSIHKEFFHRDLGWFVPHAINVVQAIEADQERILRKIVGYPALATPSQPASAQETSSGPDCSPGNVDRMRAAGVRESDLALACPPNAPPANHDVVGRRPLVPAKPDNPAPAAAEGLPDEGRCTALDASKMRAAGVSESAISRACSP